MANPLELLGGEEHLRFMLGVEKYKYRHLDLLTSITSECRFDYKGKNIKILYAVGKICPNDDYWILTVDNRVRSSLCNPCLTPAQATRIFELALDCTLSF
jgi:hypothetical protein